MELDPDPHYTDTGYVRYTYVDPKHHRFKCPASASVSLAGGGRALVVATAAVVAGPPQRQRIILRVEDVGGGQLAHHSCCGHHAAVLRARVHAGVAQARLPIAHVVLAESGHERKHVCMTQVKSMKKKLRWVEGATGKFCGSISFGGQNKM